ncbi:hypothetical protein EXN22_17735 [Pseudomonas tructae]|uniref:Uncharacterized protein n=1 Tax=Pseudomonas tructae TaxID=2518644 RepID=A0A411MKT3_9PSED|nr:hypothetical protein [Pseudomonas tructae]QBF27436.1 hypothetical protein EXN22_17735 [Pseudomonas tructae]
MKDQQIPPRILRWRLAPSYLGMCKAEFNKTVRPFVKEFPIGAQGVGFDRYELDEWADSYIAENAIDKGVGRTGLSASARKRAEEKRAEQSRSEFQKALELVKRRR